ncbi:glucan biosynthesis protein G [Amylibacter sp. SFDW26]|uniref:glucan biosynthesis protein n=1 Tax=Amylibacter sp. SFDW26 TaxID=2652722 RepID=UPI0012621404|nr:glucan biosynthesis protein G [Amylibacter sp. SFDW26]KAB7616152.1 glucan biosynthesis protein G [Amylibacter sp. SFDW26]
MHRRSFISALASFAAVAGSKAIAAPMVIAESPFSREALLEEARELAANPYQERQKVPQEWLDLSYDEYRLIQFNTKKALWRDTDSPVHVDFFHPGLYFPHPVEVNIVEDATAKKLGFDYDLFKKQENAPELPLNETLGYSGFRLRTEMVTEGKFEEFFVMQGSNYFRAIAKDQNYGLSARGLAINTADPRGEEFPDFTRFWIERPSADDTSIIIHAMMDSPSVAGLYSFTIRAGDTTVMDVAAHIFTRTELNNIGLGPLTSMFLFDETNRSRFNDFRPAVHDSDGLLIQNGAGETLWRALANPTTLQVSSFVDDTPKGFGLMQRPQGFSDYADLEALYHKRPGLWVEPGENWGKGSVTLIEIPADREIYDNIVAYWRPRAPIPAGGSHSFQYRLSWGGEPLSGKPVARVLNTRMGTRFTGGYITTIDFEKNLAIPEDLDTVTIHASSSAGEISEGILQRNPDTGGVRLAFTFDPADANSTELRAQLLVAGKTITEVWLYRWTA